MEEHIRQNIIRILDKAIIAIKQKDIKILRELSNQTIHDATIYQDEYAITVAVLIYSLSKINEREEHYSEFKGWRSYCIDCLISLEKIKQKLDSNDIKSFEISLKQYISNLGKEDKKLKLHMQEVLRNARINKASRLHEHGLSLGRTAEILGITKFELMDYVGKTYISDIKENITIDPIKRLDLARSILK